MEKSESLGMLYRTIVADPPWTPELGKTWRTRFTDKSRPQKHYATLTVDQIIALAPNTEDQAHLYIWVLNQHVDWGYRVAKAWGFTVLQMITWCKPGLGTGRFQCNSEQGLYAGAALATATRSAQQAGPGSTGRDPVTLKSPQPFSRSLNASAPLPG